ncbi:MAG: alpha/beta hydrolase [Thermoleophilaceae bacterium]|nr:alpha/beta hydrolase [Thermoleophilaceae bacterium]
MRQGEGEPLVLLHGVTSYEGVWKHVVPLLAPSYDTIAFSALGHHGGTPASERPARIAHIVDDAERKLDELGFDRVHLAGNSMGGWIAIELARRGRACTVCALSPAGTWEPGTAHLGTRDALRRMIKDARRSRRLLPLLMRSARMRRYGLALNAVHGDRVTREDLLAQTDAALDCAVLEDVLETDESIAALDPPPCPVTLAWSEEDRVLPLATLGERAKGLIPGARFVVLPGVGHVPMFDDPQLVVDTVLESASAGGSGGGASVSCAGVRGRERIRAVARGGETPGEVGRP